MRVKEAPPVYAYFKHRRVLDFIHRRWNKDTYDWTHGNCYWFAWILWEEFEDMYIYYLPIEGHFVAGMYGHYYDANGEYFCKEEPIEILDIKFNDPVWWARLMRDCKD